MGAVGVAGSGSGTGGGVHGGGGITRTCSAGVVYHSTHTSILDATVA